MVRKVLGKGLGALIPNKDQVEKSLLVKGISASLEKMILLELIQPNSKQPRKKFLTEELKELSDSIRENGVIQPIIVRKTSEQQYEIIAGERRYRAAKLAGLKEIPSLIKDASDQKSIELALVENLQRQDLSILEEARAYQLLITEHKLTQENLAKDLGKSRSSIANTIRLLNLPKDVLLLIDEGKLSFGHGKVLLSLQNEAQIRNVSAQIIKKNLNVRQTEIWMEGLSRTSFKGRKKSIDPITEILQTSLAEQLGTKVKIFKKSKGGKIEIEYYSDKDLERLISSMNLSLEAIS